MKFGIALLSVLLVVAGPGRAQQQAAGAQFEGLHAALQLTPGQEARWAAYVAATPSQAAADQHHRAAAAMFPRLTAPRRIDLVEAELKAELADLQRQSAALKALYATLTPDQQRRFDDFTMAPPPAED
ncbi:Spy/CpxP family protein refolding chaperone [Polymorphobacter fuscus]|nr:Spy/CpxP family protein refolding chaperone [Polymorphobacter fuscus]NJC07544.1 hypothetical protein [Polymorphobacter fuscus]